MDSFTILEVAPDASAAEIKRAYRRKAMQWHPDRSSHPEATERFKQIRAAYESLQNHDETDETLAEPAAEAPARAADVRLDLEVSLEEAAFGCEKEVAFDRGAACATCDGSGEAGIRRSRPCQGCHGSGRVRHRHHSLEICQQCGGRGFLSQRTCPDCGGRGKHSDQVGLRVRVPAGVMPGDELRVARQGEPGIGGLAPGDLFIRIGIKRHALFEMNGCELSYTMPVNVLGLLGGGRIEVAVLGGFEPYELEAGEIAPRTVRLAGRGYPGRRAARPGDLVIHLQPVAPRRLNAAQTSLLQQAALACDETLLDCLPEIAAWRCRHAAPGR